MLLLLFVVLDHFCRSFRLVLSKFFVSFCGGPWCGRKFLDTTATESLYHYRQLGMSIPSGIGSIIASLCFLRMAAARICTLSFPTTMGASRFVFLVAVERSFNQ